MKANTSSSTRPADSVFLLFRSGLLSHWSLLFFFLVAYPMLALTPVLRFPFDFAPTRALPSPTLHPPPASLSFTVFIIRRYSTNDRAAPGPRAIISACSMSLPVQSQCSMYHLCLHRHTPFFFALISFSLLFTTASFSPPSLDAPLPRLIRSSAGPRYCSSTTYTTKHFSLQK